MRIGVVGAGVVGRATARCWLEYCDEVRVFDVQPECMTHSRDEVYECEVVFLCVPEGDVEAVVRGIMPEEYDRTFVIKSTVPAGTTRRLAEQYGLSNLLHSPEFLTARCAATDAQMPARNVIGRPKPDDWSAAGFLADLYRNRFPGVDVHHLTSDESEFLKLAQNAFFHVKVSFMNEMHAACERLGLDWEMVRMALLADGRIAHSHTTVPGADGFGVAGACLPKDSAEFVRTLERLGLPADVTAGAIRRNEWDRSRRS